uniref:Serpin B6 n=1 Tax=Pyxicephalus adspersus TaxID=30357 RepID=A0AAV3AHU2_PYXAD|nr:TPA: hypothetical protein GDO54_012250 [Pyxicephalus adspersus]
MDSLSAANGSFAIELYKKLNENDRKCNLFFSPLSISSALAMVYLGAKGNTAAQMSKVLQFEKAKNVHPSFQSLITEINKPGTDYLLRTANRLYGEKSFAFLDDFIGSTQKHYLADLQAVDFTGKSEDCRKDINTWVEQTTEGGQNSLLYTFIALLEQELTYEKFAEIINPSNLEKIEVDLYLPKFKLENYFDLDSVLTTLGMTDVFNVIKCDLSGMSGDNDLFLSKVVHKSFVEVNEEGTEAAAATGAVVMLRCARFIPKFVCDHPFLFFIVHKQCSHILFCGRFTSP